MKRQRKLNKHIIFESVLMPFAKNIKISPCLSKPQLAKVGTFSETRYFGADAHHNPVPGILKQNFNCCRL